MRALWATAGILALVLGTVGIVLPLLPTVPFVLLAAFCFARSSDKLHHWLISHKTFGPMISDWQKNGSISKRAKMLSTVSIAGVYAISIVLQLKPTLLIIQAVVLGCVLIFIWSRPTSGR